jgi:methionine-rich copper-binding protein CopC
MTKRLLLALAAVLVVLIPAAPAAAHNPLVGAAPAKNATVKKAPAEVKLTFLEKLNPDTTKLTVTGPDGAATGGSEPKVNGKTVSVSFAQALANGKYTVAYQLTADDGDVVKSSYTFTVAGAVTSSEPASPAPVSAAPVPSTPASSAPAASAPAAESPSAAIVVQPAGNAEKVSDDSGTPWLGLAAGIGILALAAAAVAVFLRRRKTTS